ncbi:CBS domain-containing protein [Streptomyces sp. NPDC088387]|uniref:CBS domain-containing protein n=1 Tax=Streptomyces sp. NPDC088387 TaxID=3365859 RepID=UPI0037FD82F0
MPEVSAATTVADAIEVLRRNRASSAVVDDGTGRITGMAGPDDLLARCLQPRGA